MKEFYGNYRGVVIRNDDPLKAGRVKVQVFGVYDELSEAQIPWALYADPMMGGSQNIGGIVVPNVDAQVWCFFEGGDQHYPVYWAGAPAMKDKDTPFVPEESRTEGEYPQNKVFRTKAGFVFEIDDTESATRLKITQPSGNTIVSDNDGNVDETIVGNVVQSNEGDIDHSVVGKVDQTIGGTLTIDVEGKVTMRAPEMQFGEDGAVEQSVLGKKLEEWINNELTPWLNSMQHVGNLGAPTSVPIVPFDPGTAAPGAAVYSKVNTNQ